MVKRSTNTRLTLRQRWCSRNYLLLCDQFNAPRNQLIIPKPSRMDRCSPRIKKVSHRYSTSIGSRLIPSWTLIRKKGYATLLASRIVEMEDDVGKSNSLYFRSGRVSYRYWSASGLIVNALILYIRWFSAKEKKGLCLVLFLLG